MDAPIGARWNRGFTLAEVIVALGLFALIAVGSLGILGAVQSGGALVATPTAVGAVRLSKDHTAAAVYLQAVQEHLAELTAGGIPPGSYAPPFPPPWAGIPLPPSGPDQLGKVRLLVTIERWYWDPTSADGRYCVVGASGCGARAAGEYLARAVSTLTWDFRGSARSMTLARFIP